MNELHEIEAKASELGFDAFGVCPPELPAQVSAGLDAYLDAGHHGDMGWMEERKALRRSPTALWPEAKSVIVVGHNYTPAMDPMEKLKQPHIGNISSYALNDDYHDVIKKKLKTLARWLVETYGCEVKLFVDTAPVMEKPLAELAGLGWQGKHTCLISREHGNWLFLGVVFTTLPLSPLPTGEEDFSTRIASGKKSGEGSTVLFNPTDKPSPQPSPKGRGSSPCGTCTACIDICPTDAIVAPYKLDARKCLAYLSIEHKGHIPVEYRKVMGNRIYGCDDCLAICPWNKFAKTTEETRYQMRDSLKDLGLAQLAMLDDTTFRELFRKSPVKRTGRDRFVRNVCIAMGNTGDTCYLSQLEALMKDDSELVREAARWALEEINAPNLGKATNTLI